MSFDLTTIASAPSIMLGLGLFFGIVLAVAYKFLKVEEDPRIDETEGLLPGTNCGACGEPGCRAFSEKLVLGEVSPSLCTVASPDMLEAIADYLGVDAGEADKRVARLKCAGGTAQAHQIAEYHGFESCRSAAVVSAGGKGCSWGCLGLADCEVACTFDAIAMNLNGLPKVTTEKCTACGDCVDACPRDLFEIIPMSEKLYVQCNNPLAGDAAVALCSVACDACGRCAADAAPGLITMENNLPVVRYSAGGPAKPDATFRCPTGAIKWLEGNQFEEDQREIESQKRYA
jgi:RnfABCDGE-type electron transport complex B subunit